MEYKGQTRKAATISSTKNQITFLYDIEAGVGPGASTNLRALSLRGGGEQTNNTINYQLPPPRPHIRAHRHNRVLLLTDVHQYFPPTGIRHLRPERKRANV